jgi:hypothetical protein
MRLDIERAFECRVLVPLLWVVPLACVQVFGACAVEVEIFRARDDRTADAAPPGTSNSTNVLIAPGPAAANADGSCQPGHYVGAFNGTYNSAALGNGSLPLSIAATPWLGRPGLEFWLEAIPRNCRSDEEFCADFTVKGGKIRGFANPFSAGDSSSSSPTEDPSLVAVSFEIDFGGNLDCSRGKFRGLLQNGCYDVATILFRFAGTAPADYDAASASFTDGQWTVKELASANAWFPPDANIGGMGSWQASLVNDDVGLAAESAGLCDR